MKTALFALLSLLSTQAWAFTCPTFNGTFKGTISNSNYGITVDITQTDCSSISVHEYGVDRDFSYQQKIGPTTSAVAPITGEVTYTSAFFDFTNIYIVTSDTSDPNWPLTTLTVFSRTNQGKLTISDTTSGAQFTQLVYFQEI